MFRGLARVVIRLRWPIVVLWVVSVILTMRLLPSLSGVSQSGNSPFLAADAPSQRAAALAAPFQSQNASGTAVLVAARKDGPLTPADDAAFAAIERAAQSVPGVTLVRDEGVSADGRARQAVVLTDTPGQAGQTNPALVDTIRGTFATANVPSGLGVHLTGPLAQATDAAANSAQVGAAIRLGTILVVVVLLIVVYRAVLAPVVTLVPAAVGLALSQGLIAKAAEFGLPVSIATGTLLPVLLIGAGADYGLFLVFRVREEIRRGATTSDALVAALGRVGESITFSAGTVIAALSCLVVASFGLYRGLGPSLAIGVAVLLLAALTLLPALLSILGSAVFWPSRPAAGQNEIGRWGRVASRILARPLPVLVTAALIFGGLSAGLAAFRTGGFTSAPSSSTDSAAGTAILAAHFLATAANAELLLVRFDQPVTATSPAAVAAEQALRASPAVKSVSAPQLSRDGHTILFYAVPAVGVAGTRAAIDDVPALRTALHAAATTAGAVDEGVVGSDAVAYDIGQASTSDLASVVPLVLLAIGILLALLLRSLVAPIYLIVTVGLSYVASLGFASLVFITLLGDDGLNFVIPILLFIFAMALGEDYNILLMTRVREEALSHPLHEALVRAVSHTGGTITSAGVILAGTFTVLAIAGNSDQSRQLGFTIAFAILLDTFFVRTLVVPAIVSLLGRWNWWPSEFGR